jgi:hypothetical protein
VQRLCRDVDVDNMDEYKFRGEEVWRWRGDAEEV